MRRESRERGSEQRAKSGEQRAEGNKVYKSASPQVCKPRRLTFCGQSEAKYLSRTGPDEVGIS